MNYQCIEIAAVHYANHMNLRHDLGVCVRVLIFSISMSMKMIYNSYIYFLLPSLFPYPPPPPPPPLLLHVELLSLYRPK